MVCRDASSLQLMKLLNRNDKAVTAKSAAVGATASEAAAGGTRRTGVRPRMGFGIAASSRSSSSFSRVAKNVTMFNTNSVRRSV